MQLIVPVLALLLSVACGQEPIESERLGEAHLGVSAQELSVGDVTRVTITVSGPGISPDISRNLVKTSGQWSGTLGGIPVGPNRTFLAQAYDSANALLYEGQATGVSISQSSAASVFILLQQKTAPSPFRNGAPRINSLVTSASQVIEGQSASLSVTAVDPDGDTLSYSWTATGGTLANPTSSSPTWTAPALEGPYTLSVSVSDGKGGQAGFSLTLRVSKAQGGANVTTSFNTWPVVSQVSSTKGQLSLSDTAGLDATAVDPDGDTLTFAWTDNCGGSFSSATAKSPTWTAPATQPASNTCTVSVAPNDGRGGSTLGSLLIHIGLPSTPNAAPLIDQTFQSVSTVAPGGTVDVLVVAHDPEGTAISFTWSTTGGTLGTPVTTASQSEMRWTAPASGGPFTLSAVILDAGGASTTQSFTVTLPAPASTVSSFAAGEFFTLVLKTDGVLWGTGRNNQGQLGDGTLTNRNTLGQLMTGVSRVAPTCFGQGSAHTLVLKTDGTLWATGANSQGQFGDGTTTGRNTFGQVLTGVASMSAGRATTLALKTDGTLWATGRNANGQLGAGTTTDRNTFGQVLTGVSSVSAGWAHTMALKTNGTLWATGGNAHGQLGNGSTTERNTFAQVMTGVASVSAGVTHTAVVKTDGTLWITGDNFNGQLGDGTNTNRTAFGQVMTGVASVSAGGYMTVVLKTDGTVWAAGDNSQGQIGAGASTSHNTFVQVLTGVASISAGGNHTLALKTDGTLWATGDNTVGQLGNGTNTSSNTFVQVPVP